jgi:hypothetical protein
MKGKRLLGWTYGSMGRSFPDNSNTAYAVYGLHAARLAGAKMPNEIWESIRTHYLKTQRKDGGWVYSEKFGNVSYLTMDVAGLTGLIAAGMALTKDAKTVLQENASQDALKWIAKRFTPELPDRVYYCLHGTKKLGQLSGLRTIGKHDWYKEGRDFLLKAQDKDGSWPKGRQFDQWPVINASFALLFLAP